MFKQEKLLTKQDCNKVLSLISRRFSFHPSSLYWNSNSHSKTKVQSTKKTKDCYVSGSRVFELLKKPLQKLNVKSFPENDCVIIKYEKGSYFKKHIDGSSKSERTLTIMIQLSDAHEYDGGELVTYSNNEPTICSKELGNVILIDSTKPHEVLEITKGTRYSLVIWLYAKNLKDNTYIL
jgi:PKHD-type hydroxylase